MKNSIYLFVISLLIGFSSSVFAADKVVARVDTIDHAVAACQAFPVGGGNGSCIQWNDVGKSLCGGGSNVTMWDGGSYNSWCVVQNCPDGEAFDVNGVCKPACNQGDTSSASYYVPGYWSVGSGENDAVQSLPYSQPSTLCDGQCIGDVDKTASASCSSTQGVGGGTVAAPVPIQCTYSIKLTGAVCTGGNGDVPAWNPATDKLCANGASDYPTCTPPVTTCTNGGTDFPTCTPPVTTCANGASDFPLCAGTPQTGTCSNGATDYPACTSTGGGGAGTKTCINGASNYPTCTTPTRPDSSSATLGKVDESGTPTGVGTEGETGLDKAAQDRELGFADNTKRTELPWSLHFKLPEGSCTPINGSVNGHVYSMDLCPWLSKVRDAIAYLWYGLASIYLWKKVVGSTGAQA